MKHINSNQISLEKACDGLKELTAEKKTHVEHLSKMSAEAKVLYPSKTELFTSSLSQVRHKMSSAVKEVSSTVKAMTYSAHSFFAKKSPASTKPTFVSYISRLEEETSKPEKESSPTLLALSR